MEFDFTHELKRIYSSWRDIGTEPNSNFFDLFGPKGSGKTRAAQLFVRTHPHSYYISFSTPGAALGNFIKMALTGGGEISDWESAVDDFVAANKGLTLVFFDDAQGEEAAECIKAFSRAMRSARNIVVCRLSTTTKEYLGQRHVRIGYRTLADYISCLENMSRQDVLRLWALTGGIPAIAKEIDPSLSYDENISRLMEYDSAFTNYLPQMLSEHFRFPDSYMGILSSIAHGKHRLADIAKVVGFAYNKCGTYLDALIKSGFVKKENSSYMLTNSYFTAWCRYVYMKKAWLIAKPDQVLTELRNDIDGNLAYPAFKEACFCFIDKCELRYILPFKAFSNSQKCRQNVVVSLGHGETYTFDYVVMENDVPHFIVFPDSIDTRYTKDELPQILRAVERVKMSYYSKILIFSVNRFSDWCVHQASLVENLHLITADKLKY